jgi:shingomyelin synthase
MQALPDLVFMLIPQQRWAWLAGDVLSAIASVLTITLLTLHTHRWIVFRRAFTLCGIMFGLRSLCLGTTFLPPSFHHRQETCYKQNNWTQVGTI